MLVDPSESPHRSLFAEYPILPGTYDELIAADRRPRADFRRALDLLAAMTPDAFARAQALAELSLLNQGVTFSVYSDNRGTEKIFPFCLAPRMVSAAAFAHLERGLEQRLRALGLFLDDVYGDQRILSGRPILRELVLGARSYLPILRGVRPPGGVRIHVSGVDLIRDHEGTFRVLEDNLRTPSGVSYVVENRLISKRIVPQVFDLARVRRVDHYPARLAETLRSVSPEDPRASTIVVLTPGPYNSAYFEHSFLARTMGIELVQAPDLFVDGDFVYVRTTRGPRRVHVIYRRTDDAFLDPEVFRPDSALGVPGLIRAYAAGNVALANAPGNGVADDKAVYAFVPEMIRFYLGEEPILEQVPTFVCAREDDRAYVVENLERMVVKAVDEAGGVGMLMGPEASRAQRAEFRERILADPRRYIAQHRVELSTCPTWDGSQKRLAPRRVDLRPYILTSPDGPWVLPGGLSRVALREGSYVVNSSQGGGSKDTWVLKGPLNDGVASDPKALGSCGAHVISRVADHCFWFGRYLERTESTARVLAVTTNMALDGELTPEQCWLPVVIVSGEREHFLARSGGDAIDWSEAIPRYMTWDDDNLTSLVRSVIATRENARSIREVLSLEAWETTNELYLWMTSDGPDGGPAEYEKDRYAFYRHIRRQVQLCLGLLRSTMLHDRPLDFIWLGVMLERVGQTARVLDVHHHALTNLPSRQEVVETALWLSLLRACSGFEPFMKRNQGKVTAEAVASFLVFEPDFPRSVRFCLDAAYSRFFEHIRPSDQPSLPGAETAARLGALAEWLRARAGEPTPADIHGLLTHVVDETAAVCNGLARELLGYGPLNDGAAVNDPRPKPRAPSEPPDVAVDVSPDPGRQTQSQG